VSTSQSKSAFVITQTHAHAIPRGSWKPSYLSAYESDGSRSFRREEKEALKFTTRAAAERVCSRMRESWFSEAGWYLEVRELPL
jgi:hypothetical protein